MILANNCIFVLFYQQGKRYAENYKDSEFLPLYLNMPENFEISNEMKQTIFPFFHPQGLVPQTEESKRARSEFSVRRYIHNYYLKP